MPALPTRRYNTPGGYATSRETIAIMADALAREHYHPRIIARARSIVAHLPSMDLDGEIAAVWDFVLQNVRYVRDPRGAEHITAPVTLDELVDQGVAQEDCESIALYAASLLAAIGIPSEFEIQGRRPNRPDRFTHCALVVENPRTHRKIAFDPIGAWEFPGAFDLGDSLHLEGEPVQRFDSLKDTQSAQRGDGSFLGELFGDSYDDLQKVKQYGTPVAQGAMQFGPYGAILGGLFQGATAIADVGIKKQKPGDAGPDSPPGLPPLGKQYVMTRGPVTRKQVSEARASLAASAAEASSAQDAISSAPSSGSSRATAWVLAGVLFAVGAAWASRS